MRQPIRPSVERPRSQCRDDHDRCESYCEDSAERVAELYRPRRPGVLDSTTYVAEPMTSPPAEKPAPA